MAIDYEAERERMILEQLEARGFEDPLVTSAMRRVPRHLFVDRAHWSRAYDDHPLPIGEEQTISQPYVVALMAEALELGPEDSVLEIGAGSGYAAAVLSRIARDVWAIERHESLAQQARARMERLGYTNVHIMHGDGTLGWPEHAPFEAIVVSAGTPKVPEPLLAQLAIGGRLVVPVGNAAGQVLTRISRLSRTRYSEEELGDVRFVPLYGAQGWQPALAPN